LKKLLEQLLVTLLHNPDLKKQFQQAIAFLLEQPDLLGMERFSLFSMFSDSLEYELQQLSTIEEYEKKIQLVEITHCRSCVKIINLTQEENI
jgi:hypothetical protein